MVGGATAASGLEHIGQHGPRVLLEIVRLARVQTFDLIIAAEHVYQIGHVPHERALRTAIVQLRQTREFVLFRIVFHTVRSTLTFYTDAVRLFEADQVDEIGARYGAQIGKYEIEIELDRGPRTRCHVVAFDAVQVDVSVRAAHGVDGLFALKPNYGRTAASVFHRLYALEFVRFRVVRFACVETFASIVAADHVELVLVRDQAVATSGQAHFGHGLMLGQLDTDRLLVTVEKAKFIRCRVRL